ncbi:hypothetical protein BCR34DRAFT_582466 [Clohesyomyces aquaticus]|uniref:Uncharacterized protein n=1 Tax=Clohesyomyces aquaticus TaxID=1231657 RepID=A0A1Y2A9Y2_9PLEO|nr:hypothetical protein BCR34DRAFT_582466 [Clohesyomyces aquaticus]
MEFVHPIPPYYLEILNDYELDAVRVCTSKSQVKIVRPFAATNRNATLTRIEDLYDRGQLIDIQSLLLADEEAERREEETTKAEPEVPRARANENGKDFEVMKAQNLEASDKIRGVKTSLSKLFAPDSPLVTLLNHPILSPTQPYDSQSVADLASHATTSASQSGTPGSRSNHSSQSYHTAGPSARNSTTTKRQRSTGSEQDKSRKTKYTKRKRPVRGEDHGMPWSDEEPWHFVSGDAEDTHATRTV